MTINASGVVSNYGYYQNKETSPDIETKMSDLEIKRANLEKQVFDKNWREVVANIMVKELLEGVS
jgi:hypothetical protein